MCTWICLLYITLIHAYPLVDGQYPTPQCTVRGGESLLNSFGDLTLETDAFGESLALALALNASSVSCRLCAANPLWCQTQLQPHLTATTTTSYNVRLFTLTQSGLAIASQYLLGRQDTQLTVVARSLFPWNGPPQASVCGLYYRVVVQVWLSSDSPQRDYVATVLGTGTMPCDPRAGASGLSCRSAANYSYVDLSFTNCINTHAQSHAQDWRQDATIHSTLYWEAQRLLGQWPLGMPLLCGQSLDELWQYTAPQNYVCDSTYALYIKPRPWYEAMLEASAAYLNQQGYVDTELMLMLDTLQYYCDVRDHDLTLTLQDSLLLNLTLALQSRHLQPDAAEECRDVPVQAENLTLPYFVDHYYDWQLQFFQYMFALDSRLNTKAALWISAVCVTGALCLAIACYGAWRVYRRWPRYNVV